MSMWYTPLADAAALALTGAPTIAPPLVSNTSTIYGPTIARTIKPSVLGDGDTVYGLSLKRTVKPVAISDADGFYLQTLRVTVKPVRVDDADSIYGPTLGGGKQPQRLNNTSTFYVHKLTSKVTVAALATNGQTFYDPWVGTLVFVPSLPADVAGGAAFGEFAIGATTVGGNAVEAPQFINVGAFYTHTIKTVVTPSALLSDGDTLYAPAVARTVKPAFVDPADTFYTPTLSAVIKPARLDDTDTFPTVTLNVTLKPVAISDGDTFYAPGVGGGIRPDVVTNVNAFFSPSLASLVKPALLPDPDFFFSTRLRRWMQPAAISDADGFYAQSLKLTLKPARLDDTDTLYGPGLTQAVKPSLVGPTTGFFGPLITKAGVVLPPFVNDGDVFFTVTVIAPQADLGGSKGGFDPYVYKRRNKRRDKIEDVRQFMADVLGRTFEEAPPVIAEQVEDAKQAAREALALAPSAIDNSAAIRKALDEINGFYRLLRDEVRARKALEARRAAEALAAEDDDDEDFFLLVA